MAGSGASRLDDPDRRRARGERRHGAHRRRHLDALCRLLASPIATGDSILYVLDSKAEQLLIYRYLLGKGVQVVAARKIDYDLRMSGYKDFSEYSRDELKALFEKQRARSLAKSIKKR